MKMTKRPDSMVPVTPAEARAFALEKLAAAEAGVLAGVPGARADLAIAIGVWTGTTGESPPERVRMLLGV
jgi:hypothetical protein